MPRQRPGQFPGAHLPLNFVPGIRNFPGPGMYPTLLDDDQIRSGHACRRHFSKEIKMMRVMNEITELQDWHRLVLGNNIHFILHNLFICHALEQTPETMDWIIDELRWRAYRYVVKGQVNVFDGVVKSDTAISSELRQALTDATRPLIQPSLQTGTRNKYQILVDPMSYPLMFGRTKVLMDGEISLGECLVSGGLGSTISLHHADRSSTDLHLRRQTIPNGIIYNNKIFSNYDMRHQCIPFDVKFTKQGCQIESYINDLHPRTHAGTYRVIEKIISQTIPLWNESLSQDSSSWKRLDPRKAYFDPPIPQWGNNRCRCENYLGGQHETTGSCPECRDIYSKWVETRRIVNPEPLPFVESPKPPATKVNLRGQFAKKGVQILARIESVNLAPGGSRAGDNWHVEGALNEHICATALLCYDMENISLRKVRFRHRFKHDINFWFNSFMRDVPAWVNKANWEAVNSQLLDTLPHPYAEDNDAEFDLYNVIQELGKVPLREGRLVVFPSNLQSRSTMFRTKDSTKPGSCKILALFLVDPHLRVISTAKVPPQRKDWWTEREWLINFILCCHLPQELVNMVFKELDRIEDYPMTWKVERTTRLRMIRARKEITDLSTDEVEQPDRGYFDLAPWIADFP